MTMTRKSNRNGVAFVASFTVMHEPENIQEMQKQRGPHSITHQQAENVRDLIRRLLKERYAGNRAELGRSIGVKGQAISMMLSGTNRPGWATVRGLESLLNASAKAILAGKVDLSVERSVASELTPAGGDFSMVEGNVEHMADLLRLRDLPRATYPRLEFALGFYAHEPNRWSPVTVLAARQGQFEPECRGWSSPEWVAKLDALDRALSDAQLAPRTKHPELPPRRT